MLNPVTWYVEAAQRWAWKGVSVLALGLAVGAFVLAYAGANPAAETIDHVAEPVASSLGIIEGRCPSGWSDTSANDEHALVRSCTRDGWVVVLNPDGSFDHAIQLDTPGSGIIEDPAEVPEWD